MFFLLFLSLHPGKINYVKTIIKKISCKIGEITLFLFFGYFGMRHVGAYWPTVNQKGKTCFYLYKIKPNR